MGWFENKSGSGDDGSGYGGSRWRRPYDYASRYAQESPTIFGAIITLVWCVAAVLSKQETIGTVAGPAFTAILFLFHNIHVRKARQEVNDALEEVREARSQVTYARNDLRDNTEQTTTAVESASLAASHAAQAAASARRIEELTARIDAKLDALHTKVS